MQKRAFQPSLVHFDEGQAQGWRGGSVRDGKDGVWRMLYAEDVDIVPRTRSAATMTKGDNYCGGVHGVWIDGVRENGGGDAHDRAAYDSTVVVNRDNLPEVCSGQRTCVPWTYRFRTY